MGQDMDYQAIPDHSGLLERALQDPEFGELLQFLPMLYQRGASGWQDGMRLEFWESACKLAKEYPGLAKRNCCIDRRWDQLHYLLSRNRRGETGNENDALLDKAILGSKLGELQGGQGFPIGYISSSEISQIADLLRAMTIKDLRTHYAPEKMEAQKVYKFFVSHADESDWTFTEETFTTFRNFYLETAASKERVLAILD